MTQQTDVTADGKAVVVSAGPPGAGKTEALATFQLQGYRRIDPDIAKDLLLAEADHAALLDYRYAYTLPDGRALNLRELAPHIHQYSTQVTDVVRALALNAGENVVIDGTLSWKPLVENYIDELNRAGYEDLDVVDVEAPLEVALARVKQRWWTGRNNNPLGGRFLSEHHIRVLYDNPAESKCASNAVLLAELAREELGRGSHRRFDVAEPTNKPQLTSETTFP